MRKYVKGKGREGEVDREWWAVISMRKEPELTQSLIHLNIWRRVRGKREGEGKRERERGRGRQILERGERREIARSAN